MVVITNSNLGKAEFFNIDLHLIDSLFLNNSFLIDCTFVNLRWPEKLNSSKEIVDSGSLMDLKEVYRQLKYSYYKQANSVLEHKFHGLEMSAYGKYLIQSKELYTRKGMQTGLILFLSWFTSDYGQSFIRPLVILSVLNAALFSVFVKTGGGDMLFFQFNFSCHQIIDTIGEAMAFVNPLRKFEASHSGWPIIIDLAMRIISSYCLYNVIRATRRFVK